MKSCFKCQQKNICKVYEFVKSFVSDIEINIDNCKYATYQEQKIEKKSSYGDRVETIMKTIKKIELEKNTIENANKEVITCGCCKEETVGVGTCCMCGKSICENCMVVNPLDNEIVCEECFYGKKEDEEDGSSSTESSSGKIEE